MEFVRRPAMRGQILVELRTICSIEIKNRSKNSRPCLPSVLVFHMASVVAIADFPLIVPTRVNFRE